MIYHIFIQAFPSYDGNLIETLTQKLQDLRENIDAKNNHLECDCKSIREPTRRKNFGRVFTDKSSKFAPTALYSPLNQTFERVCRYIKQTFDSFLKESKNV